jgi:phosphopantothenoylcysteine decarboxylase/phosphopantothenate--cysteine ligase
MQSADQKIKKEKGAPTIYLEPNPDILQAVYEQRKESGHELLVVGFAAETENLLENAMGKLERKGMAMIVANDVSAQDAGFNVDTNRVTLLDREGRREHLPLQSKEVVAERIVERVVEMLIA